MIKATFKIIDRVFMQIEEWSLFIAVCTALVVAMANVVLRKLTADFNLFWSDEIVRKTIYFTTYIGCVAAIRSRSLIRIDALPQLFPVLKKPLAIISHVAVLVFSGAMIHLGWQMTMSAFHDEHLLTTSLRIPEWYFYAVLPLMGVMMLLRTLIVMVEDWQGKVEP